MTPELARVKRGARTAVELCGGVDGAAATTGKGRSTTGRWMSRNDPDTPTLESALAMDAVAIAAGHEPPCTTALARELGGVFLRFPEAPSGDGAVIDWLGRLSGEVGDVMRSGADMLRDGREDDAEIDDVVVQLDEVLAVGAQMRAALLARRTANKGGV